MDRFDNRGWLLGKAPSEAITIIERESSKTCAHYGRSSFDAIYQKACFLLHEGLLQAIGYIGS